MHSGNYLTALKRDGGLIADIAASTDLDTPVPTCPGWTLRDLVAHVGGVHRWAAAHVAPPRTTPLPAEQEAAVMAAPDDRTLVGWFRIGLAHLMRVLQAGDPHAAIWHFHPAPNGLAFWTRRQAHETAIHRVDAQSVTGTPSVIDPRFAADGIDELLYGFFARPGRVRSSKSYAISLHAVDIDQQWLVTVGPEGTETVSRTGPADVAVHGPAADLYLLLWNRRSTDGLQITGAEPALDHWRAHAQVH